ncbi:MAG: hypothetical protein JWO09_916 [Bacteroidetes bacterium]|nr:hypothetical protein [Bacteroidota bacterium]
MAYLARRMKNKAILLFIILIAFQSCQEKQDKNTALFSNYLIKEFNTQIPDSLHYYILIPKLVCKGCSLNTLIELDTLMNAENERCFTFISTNEHISPKEFKRARFIEYDTRGKLDDLDLDIANVTVVKTRHNKVVFIKPIYIDEKRPLSEIITFE